MFSDFISKLREKPMYYGMIVVSIVILIITSYLVYQNMKPQLKTQLEPGSSSSSSSSSDAEIIFFFANWCPHCKAAKPQWKSVKEEYNGKTIKGYKIVFTEVDCTEENPKVKEMTEQYDIEGYPTIKLVKDGQIIDYDAKPSKETLEKFINTVL